MRTANANVAANGLAAFGSEQALGQVSLTWLTGEVIKPNYLFELAAKLSRETGFP